MIIEICVVCIPITDDQSLATIVSRQLIACEE